MPKLLDAAAPTGTNTYGPVEVGQYEGGDFAMFGIADDWTGATLKAQVSPDGGTTWLDVTGASLTANGYKTFSISGEVQLRLHLVAGSGSVFKGWINKMDSPLY